MIKGNGSASRQSNSEADRCTKWTCSLPEGSLDSGSSFLHSLVIISACIYVGSDNLYKFVKFQFLEGRNSRNR